MRDHADVRRRHVAGCGCILCLVERSFTPCEGCPPVGAERRIAGTLRNYSRKTFDVGLHGEAAVYDEAANFIEEQAELIGQMRGALAEADIALRGAGVGYAVRKRIDSLLAASEGL